MAVFARLNDASEVISVHAVANDVLVDDAGVEQESLGVQFLRDTHKEQSSQWKQGSYNTFGGVHTVRDPEGNTTTGGTQFRMNAPAVGYTYDDAKDAFIPPKVFESWVLDEATCQWKAPIPHPTEPVADEAVWIWNEATVSWDLNPGDKERLGLL